MYNKIAIILVLGLSSFTNASFFGLFSSSPTPKPDAVVSESNESPTDNLAYQNYLRSLVRAYSPIPSTHYVYAVRPQYTEYVQPQQSYIYQTVAIQDIQHKSPALQQTYHQQAVAPNVKFQKPITVLPSASYQPAALNIPEVTQSMNKLIEAPGTSSISTAKILEMNIPEPQMPTSLYDLPVSGIAPDFRTGGYVTKTLTSISPDNNKRLGRRFGHAYTNGDSTKVSEEGQVIYYGNGHETVVKRGQYEYIDAAGKPVLVKWIADDNGFRLVN